MYKILVVILLSIFYSSFAHQPTLSNQYPEVLVYYGMNDSHSKSWAQISDETIGITYFQHDIYGQENGTLLYKTINFDGTEYTDTIL